MLDVSLEYQKLQMNQRIEVNLCFHNSGNETLINIIFTVNLPGKIILLKGKRKVENPQLKPGEKVQNSLTLIPKASGQHIISIPNFSNRDCLDKGKELRILAYN